ncbi:MAG TPA: NADH:flavin oxidoreductase [Planctomycetota bacterium]|nr:NADH:flavin oxidoreductase [Planctomycetota bacterium]
MRHPSPGHFRSVDELREHLHRIDPTWSIDGEVLGPAGALARPIEVCGRTLGNRFACHPMEGWDGTADGRPTDLTRRRWRHFGRSGAALVWGGEAFAVQRDGRANAGQLYLEPNVDVAASLADLLAQLCAGAADAGLAADTQLVGLQLTHSGRFARPEGPPKPLLAYAHPLLALKYPGSAKAPVLTDGELEGIGENFVRCAALAWRTGFHFVDVKCCHGYLLHELLGARARPGPYGGDFAGRTRLFERIVAGIRTECPGLHIGVRISLADTVPFERDPATGLGRPMAAQLPYEHGFGVDAADPLRFDLAEPFAFLRRVQALGIELVNVSLGSPYWNPHLQRPAAYPPSDGYQPPDDPLRFVWTHLQVVRAAKAAVPGLRLVGTGYTYLQEWLGHVAQHEVAQGHVDFVGLGRMLLSYPELPCDLLAARPVQRKRLCRTFSDCTTAPRNGMVSGCYPLDPHYRSMPEAAAVKALRGGTEP